MSAFPAALRSELLRASRDRALLWLAVLFAFVCAYASVTGAGWISGRQAALQSAAELARADRESVLSHLRKIADSTSGGNDGTDLRVSAGVIALALTTYPALPTKPLAPLAVGQMQGYPYVAKVHVTSPAHRIFEGVGHNVENPENLAAGFFDLAFVIVFLLPLALLAATYDIWAQEREAGTSALLLSQPVHPGTILAAKALTRGGLLLVVCIVEVSILLTWLTSAEEMAGVLATGAVMLLYGMFWIALALVVNRFARNSVAAAVSCAAAWLAVVMLLPACVSAAVDLMAPAPSHAKYVNALREKELQLDVHAAGESGQSDRTQRIRNSVREAQRRDTQIAPLVDTYRAQQARRRELSDKVRFLTPAAIAQDALERIAGTDADRALAFQAQALSFVGSLRRFVVDNLVPGEGESFESAARRVPAFSLQEVDALREAPLRADVLALVAWVLAAAALLPWRSRRAVFVSESVEKI